MKKQDWIPVVILFALLLAYPQIDQKVLSRFFPAKEQTPAPAAAEPAEPAAIPSDTALAAAPKTEPAAEPVPADEPAGARNEEPAPAPEPVPKREKAAEELLVLSNNKLEVTLTTHGAGLLRAAMTARDEQGLRYPAEAGSDAPVTFDFADRPAAAPVGYPGLQERDDFEVIDSGGDTATFRKTLPSGLVLTRTLTLGDTYQLRLRDEIRNPTAAAIPLRGYGLQSGFMENLPGETAFRGPTLGLDTLTGSEGVEYWGGKFEKWFPERNRELQRTYVPGPKEEPIHADWAAVKNKYFTQILTPENGADRVRAVAARGAPERSSFLGIFPRTSQPIERIGAAVLLPDYDLDPGQSLALNSTFYIGPKVYADLRANGPHQEDILQLGFWRPIGILILKIMVWIQAHIWPYSYGLAIILLTVLIRTVFWPLNHKAMVSTRHMQEVQPLIAALKEKYKGDPQKQHQEMMALYKEHKINPMGGCLPMLVQIPVFFALFVVLRGAIELRFSSFLWISDLSTPENLFKDHLPIAINILPIFMGFTMWLQQKLTPSGDDQQQRMMMMMPVIFTVMFYSFPSGLSLYWSTNQVLMIVQLLWMRKRHPSPVRK